MREIDFKNTSVVDQWILSRLKNVTGTLSKTLDDYKFNEAAGALYGFVWHEFCDWYLEASKPSLYDKMGEARKLATKSVLWRVLHDILILLHPFVPFVTEEIWNKLPGSQGSIMKATFPEDNIELSVIQNHPEAEAVMNLIMSVISGIRNIRGEMQIAPSAMLKAFVHSSDDVIRNQVSEYSDLIKNMARLDDIVISLPGKRPRSSAMAVLEGAQVFVSLEGVVDLDKEKGRLEKEIGKVDKELSGLEAKLNNDSFMEKAPDHVVVKVREQHQGLIEKKDKLTANLEKIVLLIAGSE